MAALAGSAGAPDAAESQGTNAKATMKLKIGNVDIECTVTEAIELLAQLQKRWINAPSIQPSYKITYSSTPDTRAIVQSVQAAMHRPPRIPYSSDVTGDSVHNYD